MHTSGLFGSYVTCDLVKLIGLTLLFVGVSAYTPQRLRRNEDEDLNITMGNLRNQIELTISYLPDKRNCTSSQKTKIPGVKHFRAIGRLNKKSNVSELRKRIDLYEDGLIAYKNTFKQIRNERKTRCEIHAPNVDQLQMIIDATSMIRKEWNALIYDDMKSKKTDKRRGLCKRKKYKDCSDLCMCASRQIERYREFLQKMSRNLRKISAKQLKKIVGIIKSTQVD